MTPAARAPTIRTTGDCLGGLHDRTGKGVRRYGHHGDRCQHPGCDALLSDYNGFDRCTCHGAGGRKRILRKRGEDRSAGHAVATTAAEPPRHVTGRELEMSAKKRQEESEAKVRIEAALTDEYATAPVIAMRAKVTDALAYYHLKRLVESGRAENKLGKGGGYRRRSTPLARMAEAADAMTEEDEWIDDWVEDAPAAPSGAAPAPTPEPLADPATPDPPSTRESPGAGYDALMAEGYREMAEQSPGAGTDNLHASLGGIKLGPFPEYATGGVVQEAGTGESVTGGGRGGAMTVNWFTPRTGRARLSPVAVLAALEDMDEEERAQVLGCIGLLWGCDVEVKGAGQ